MERKISSVHVLFNARVLIVLDDCSSYMWISELCINVVVLLDQPLLSKLSKVPPDSGSIMVILYH